MQESIYSIQIGDDSICLGGIAEIISFNDSSFEAETERGLLQITGENLKMEKTLVDKGEVLISGKLISLYYPENRQIKKGFLKGIFG